MHPATASACRHFNHRQLQRPPPPTRCSASSAYTEGPSSAGPGSTRRAPTMGAAKASPQELAWNMGTTASTASRAPSGSASAWQDMSACRKLERCVYMTPCMCGVWEVWGGGVWVGGVCVGGVWVGGVCGGGRCVGGRCVGGGAASRSVWQSGMGVEGCVGGGWGQTLLGRCRRWRQLGMQSPEQLQASGCRSSRPSRPKQRAPSALGLPVVPEV
jgi:hypothetical protein